MATKKTVTQNREDLSRFVVHLTRDSTPDPLEKMFGSDEVAKARDNLISILKAKKIEARNPHCIVNPKLKDVDSERRKRLNVVCLTEVPLNQIHLLTQEIEGRLVKLQPYGLVFQRSFVIEQGGQPAIYLNGYNGNTFLTAATFEIFEGWLKEEHETAAWRLLPFTNSMHEKYDFTWEREWRVRGDLEFKATDLVAVILPTDGDEDIRRVCVKGGVAVISPGWTYEQIVSELSSQQRTGNKLLKSDLQKLQGT